jgi:hypothetical protein
MVANIVTNSRVDAPDDFNVVSSIYDINEGLPTMIIGYDYVVKNYPNFDITEKSLGDDLYWTFKNNELRDKHTEDLLWFIHKVYKDNTDKISYIFLDLIQYKRKTILKIIKKIKSMDKIITYQYKDMLYLYGDNFIFGVDLKLVKYFGFEPDKIKDKIKTKSTVFLVQNDILIEYKKCINYLNGNIKFVPYLYSIKNEQNNNISHIHNVKQS